MLCFMSAYYTCIGNKLCGSRNVSLTEQLHVPVLFSSLLLFFCSCCWWMFEWPKRNIPAPIKWNARINASSACGKLAPWKCFLSANIHGENRVTRGQRWRIGAHFSKNSSRPGMIVGRSLLRRGFRKGRKYLSSNTTCTHLLQKYYWTGSTLAHNFFKTFENVSFTFFILPAADRKCTTLWLAVSCFSHYFFSFYILYPVCIIVCLLHLWRAHFSVFLVQLTWLCALVCCLRPVMSHVKCGHSE